MPKNLSTRRTMPLKSSKILSIPWNSFGILRISIVCEFARVLAEWFFPIREPLLRKSEPKWLLGSRQWRYCDYESVCIIIACHQIPETLRRSPPVLFNDTGSAFGMHEDTGLVGLTMTKNFRQFEPQTRFSQKWFSYGKNHSASTPALLRAVKK